MLPLAEAAMQPLSQEVPSTRTKISRGDVKVTAGCTYCTPAVRGGVELAAARVRSIMPWRLYLRRAGLNLLLLLASGSVGAAYVSWTTGC
jgi:hypothetical protein